MIKYSNGRFRSYRPVDEARKLVEAEINSLDAEEKAALEVLIQELTTQQEKEVLNEAERMEWDPDTGPPVPISQWVNDSYYLGETARTLWPKLKEDMIEFFEGDYAECILCLHPDTRIPLLDGTTPTIKELADRWDSDQTPYWVYSYKDGEIVPAKAVEPRKTGVDDYFKVTLEDGTSFIGNARHQMVLRDGRKRMIKDMVPGDSIMPFNATLSSSANGDAIDGYEKIQLLDGSWDYTHRVVARRLCTKCDGDEDAGLATRNVFGRTYRRGRTNKVDPDNPPGPKPKLTVEAIQGAIDDGSTTTRAAAARLGVSKKTIYNTLKREGICWADLCELVGNHYVVSIEKVGRGDVYCMTVPDAGNFAISTNYGKEVTTNSGRSGVFSSNTGSTRW